jgi:enoyl-CoA hydratase/carnithine racemase
VVPAADLSAAVAALADAVLAANPRAVAATKQLLRSAARRTLDGQRAAERVAQVARLRDLAGLSAVG